LVKKGVVHQHQIISYQWKYFRKKRSQVRYGF
jgi:hypothetical protein